MYPAATLFFDLCVQVELWPGATWPLIRVEHAGNVARMFAIARALPVRQGGVVCCHAPDGVAAIADAPLHCSDAGAAILRPPACDPVLPIQVRRAMDATGLAGPLDREWAIYVDSGCAQRPDVAGHAHVFDHLVSGVRDAVIFGAGIEYGMAGAIEALLSRRIRTHLVLDASGAGDEVAAQAIVATWKRRGVDVTTVAMIERMLTRN